MLFYYIPLWAFNLGNIYLIFCVIKFMRGFKGLFQDQEIRLSQMILMNMVSYPVIMILCWSGFTIYKIGKICGTDVSWLEGTRFIFSDLIGFFNSITYFINHLLFKKLQDLNQNDIQITHLIDDDHDRPESWKVNCSFRSFMSTDSEVSPYDLDL